MPDAAPAGGHVPGPRPPPLSDEVRQMYLDLRRRLRERMKEMEEETEGRPPRNGAIFYSGVDEACVRQFCDYLVAINPREPADRQIRRRPVYLEATPAGKLLYRMTRMVLKRQLLVSPDDDWSRRVTFRSEHEKATVSLIGFWRELSARYARMVEGTVHVLLGPSRNDLPEEGARYWNRRMFQRYSEPDAAPLPDHGHAHLRTFGFVELPILMNAISDNQGVDRLAIYRPGGGWFARVREIEVRHSK